MRARCVRHCASFITHDPGSRTHARARARCLRHSASCITHSFYHARSGQPDEIWAGIRFILECDYFTGRVLEIDGGMTGF